MSLPRFDIISIGTLSRNRLWGESQKIRTPHATTTLIRSQKRSILVDPGLPGIALAARLQERAGITPDKIDAVFLTNFRPSHRAGLNIFTHADVYLDEMEQQYARAHLERMIDEAPEEDIDRRLLEQELDILKDTKSAPDELLPMVDLFPLRGYTPGNCGLLIKLPTFTALIAGDAVPSQDHLLAGQVLPDCHDIKAAQESLREVYEIADLIIPGHDNLFMNPRSMGM